MIINGQALAYEFIKGYELPEQVNWSALCAFSEGLVAVENDSQYSVIDNRGQIVLPLSYQFVLPFAEELALIAKDDKHGYINELNEVVVPLAYDYPLNPFVDDVDTFVKDNQIVYVNRQGDVVKINDFSD